MVEGIKTKDNSVQTIFVIDVDTTTGEQKVRRITETCKEAKILLYETEQHSFKTFNRVLAGARLAWGVIQGAVRAAGGAISMTTRLVVSAGIGAIQTLVPIFHALILKGALTLKPNEIVMAIMGLAQMTAATIALIQYQVGQKDVSMQLRGLDFMFNNISLMLGMVSL